MKKTIYAALMLLAAGPAFAADLPLKARPPVAVVYDWTGFYAGANVGYGWNDHGTAPLCTDPTGAVNGPGCQNVPSQALNAHGAIGGGQIGYNRQWDRWVGGVEADFQAADIGGSAASTGFFNFFSGAPTLLPTTFNASERMQWFGTVRGRVGYAFDRVLVYATGGLAYAETRMSGDFFRTGAFNFAYDVHSLRTGWTAGGGIEYAFAGPWTAKFEGLVYDLGKSSPLVGPTLVTGPLVAGFARGNTFNWQGAIVRVGVNYKFAQ